MSKLSIIKCDICDKSHEGFKTPDSWFEFYYEYSELIGGKNRELCYEVCSFKCYVKQLIKCLNWSQSHCDVKIAGMSREFVIKLLRGCSVVVPDEEKIFDLPKSEVEKEEKKIKKKFGDSEFFKQFTSGKEAIISFRKKYPESVELDTDLYKRWYYYNNKEKYSKKIKTELS